MVVHLKLKIFCDFFALTLADAIAYEGITNELQVKSIVKNIGLKKITSNAWLNIACSLYISSFHLYYIQTEKSWNLNRKSTFGSGILVCYNWEIPFDERELNQERVVYFGESGAYEHWPSNENF